MLGEMLSNSEFDVELRRFSNRLNEIKLFKNITIKDLVSSSGISQNIIERMLNGSRMGRPNEILQLTNGFGAENESRFFGDDWSALVEHLRTYVSRNEFTDEIVRLIVSLDKIALTHHEIIDAWFFKTKLLRHQKNIQEANTLALKNYEYTKQHLPISDPALATTCTELLQVLFYTKEYSQLEALCNEVENKNFFSGNMGQQGLMSFYRASYLLLRSETRLNAKAHLERAHDFFKITNHTLQAAVLHNLASIEHLEGNYETALSLFENAIELNESNHYYRLACLKDYARTLACVKQEEKALQVINSTLLRMDSFNLNFEELRAKLLLAKADITKESEYLNFILSPEWNPQLIANIHSVLCDCFEKVYNAQKVLFHHKSCLAILKSYKFSHWMRGDWY